MNVYEVKVYDKDKKLIHSDYYDGLNKDSADKQGKEDCKLFNGVFYSVRQLRFL